MVGYPWNVEGLTDRGSAEDEGLCNHGDYTGQEIHDNALAEEMHHYQWVGNGRRKGAHRGKVSHERDRNERDGFEHIEQVESLTTITGEVLCTNLG